MKQNKTLAVLFAGQELKINAEVELYTVQDRLKKAAQAFGICGLVALCCVPVPAIHFILAPMAVACGPFAALFVFFRVKHLPKTIDGGVACRHCGTMQSFHFKEAKPPLYEECHACKVGYEVVWPPKS